MLINASNANDAVDAINETLRPVTHPDGSGACDTSSLIDYSIGDVLPANSSTDESFAAGLYIEGSFDPQ
jgi:hypothetical protein